jgi:hypothetical protein
MNGRYTELSVHVLDYYHLVDAASIGLIENASRRLKQEVFAVR